jgi:hypothetical protein
MALDNADAGPVTSTQRNYGKSAKTINGAAFLRIDADILRP